MAARHVDLPEDAEAMRQRLQEGVVSAIWLDLDVRSRLAMLVSKRIPDMEMLIVDDTGFPKKGKKSPGVTRQYSGTMGRVDNCQVAVSVHLAGVNGRACLAMSDRHLRRMPPPHAPHDARLVTGSQADAAMRWAEPIR